jgi:hypothetical protein
MLGEINGITVETESSLSDIIYVKSVHADLTHWGTCEDHTSFVLFDNVLISGDCHTLDSMNGATIFAVAINGGPWGSLKTFLDMVSAMDPKPQKVLPLHDWHWNDKARANFYTGLDGALKNLGIEFVALDKALPVEV